MEVYLTIWDLMILIAIFVGLKLLFDWLGWSVESQREADRKFNDPYLIALREKGRKARRDAEKENKRLEAMKRKNDRKFMRFLRALPIPVSARRAEDTSQLPIPDNRTVESLDNTDDLSAER